MEVRKPEASITLEERDVMTRPGWPCMAFIERAVEDDPTNWWAPNHACVEAMVRAAGFTVTARPGHEIYICEPNPNEPRVQISLRELELQDIFHQRALASSRHGEKS